MAYENLSAALPAPAAHPMAKPGYGKRSAPDQKPPRRGDFDHLAAREAYLAALLDRLCENAAMDAKTIAKAQPLYGQQSVRSALNELSRAGHLRRVRRRAETERNGAIPAPGGCSTPTGPAPHVTANGGPGSSTVTYRPRPRRQLSTRRPPSPGVPPPPTYRLSHRHTTMHRSPSRNPRRTDDPPPPPTTPSPASASTTRASPSPPRTARPWKRWPATGSRAA